MDFIKMHGLGNDFVIFSQYDKLPDNAPELALKICDRHFGVGADGLVFILPSDVADIRMRIMNSDGSEAEQCGNAIRCVAKHAYDNKLTDKQSISIETQAGVKQVNILLKEGMNEISAVTVNMGEPVLKGELIPTAISKDLVLNYPIEIEGNEFSFTAVSMGNPHAVIFVKDAANFDVEKWGPIIETHPLFPKKTNVEFVTVKSSDEVIMRVWERGVGQTLACGTGACATAVASVLTGQSARNVLVCLKGGDLRIVWNEKDNNVYMTGEAKKVFKGKWIE